MPYRGQSRSSEAVGYNAAALANLFGPINVSASQVLATALDVYTVPQDAKILEVGITALAISGAATVQIAVGLATAPSGTGTADIAVVAGNQVFTAPVSIDATGITGGKGQTVSPAQRDAIYPAGTQLTLRSVTAAGNTVTGLKISAALAAQSASVQSGEGSNIGLAADVTP